VLSQGEPHDAAVNFDTYHTLQWHRAVSLPQLSSSSLSAENAGLLSKVSKDIATEIAKNVVVNNHTCLMPIHE